MRRCTNMRQKRKILKWLFEKITELYNEYNKSIF